MKMAQWCKVSFTFLLLQMIIIFSTLRGEMTGGTDDPTKNDRLPKVKVSPPSITNIHSAPIIDALDINLYVSLQGIRTSDYNFHGNSHSDYGSRNTFQITLRNMGAVQAYDSSFVKAKSRWERVILNDLPDVPAKLGIDWFSGVFGSGKAVNNSIDDVLIGYSVTDIDGIPSSGNNILGQAMPLYVRLTSKLSAPPISGMMIFDKADFDSMHLSDVELIIAHEMVRKELNIETMYSFHTLESFFYSICIYAKRVIFLASASIL